MIGRILLINFILVFGFFTLAYLVARAKKRIDTVDVCWGLGFIVAAWGVQVQAPTGRSLIVASIVSIWGIRLASHIYAKHKGKHDDPRYKEITGKWKGNIWNQAYFKIFLLQAGLVMVVGLPIVMIANQQLLNFDWFFSAGLVIWIIGFYIEVVADSQLKSYLKLTNRPKVLKTGLWKYSRHPNYFGELTMWWGIGVMALTASYGWIGLVGPAVLSYLMIFVSGIPPIERRRSKDPEYREYMRKTSPLVILPPRK